MVDAVNQLAATPTFPTPENAVIVVDKLTKTYAGNVEAVKSISFAVGEGEFFGFLGPNGAGKSTTIKILITLLARTGGTAQILGYDVATHSTEVRRLIGYSAQDANPDFELTARENLDIQGNLYHLDRPIIKKRTEELLELMDLTEAANRKVGTFSGGQRKRLDLACALIHRPRILFLDEPTTGLDPQNRAGLWRYLERLNKEEGLTIFLTTHYMEEADKLCHRLAIIDHGTIISEGSPAQLKTALGGDIINLTFKDNSVPVAEQVSQAQQALAAQTFIRSMTPGSKDQAGTLAVVVESGSESVPIVLRTLDAAGIHVAGLALTSPSLDDVFLKYTGTRIRQEDPVPYFPMRGPWGASPRPRRP